MGTEEGRFGKWSWRDRREEREMTIASKGKGAAEGGGDDMEKRRRARETRV